ncbi:MAG: NADH-quinone oxidoreductase subunit M [Alphaproteobacteria bacterium]|nr:MAG: NADH-quinone oxidoreductase subunit M [Alphaproteobacteria bacterium]
MNFDTFPILSLMTFMPLLGAFFVMMIRGEGETVRNNAVNVGAFVSFAVFILSLITLYRFDGSSPDFQFVEEFVWFSQLNLTYKMGVDGISIFFVLLAALLTPMCILLCKQSVTKRLREYVVALLVLETFMIGTFCALDGILFYIFFEGVLIPMFIIIGVWGGANRVYSAFKFFLFTLLGSVLMLLALIYLFMENSTTDITVMMDNPLTGDLQFWLFLAFFASFAVKMPMWPVHTWLPDAHVEAPTGGSVILAGVLLKMGGYGFLRFSLPMFPEASALFAPYIFGLSVIAIIYTSLIALVQTDMKKMIAYSSVAHMGYVTLGIFTATTQGVEGAIFQMISHGLISAALFLCVGVVYDRLHTREISRYGGIVKNMPKYATLFMLFMLGSVGLPGTSGFVGEFLVLMGAFQVDTVIGTLAASGLVLGATYMLWLYRQVVFGPVTNKDAAKMSDVNGMEKFILIPLVLMVLWLGIQPNFILDRIGPSVNRTLENYYTAISLPTTDLDALIKDVD